MLWSIGFAAALSCVRPLHVSLGGPGCGGDYDCKGDRVCEKGRCVATPSGVTTPRPELPRAEDPNPFPPAARKAAPGQAMFRMNPKHQGRSPYRLPTGRPAITWAYQTRGRVTSTPALLSTGALVVGSHDGRIHLVGPTGDSQFIAATGDLVFGSPAVTAEGLVLIGSDDDHLYAFDVKEKREAWRFRVGRCPTRTGVGPQASRCDVEAGPTIGPDGTIYLGGDGLYALRPDGTLKWRFATGGHVASSPALMADGTVVAGCQDNLIYAVSPNGVKRWDFRAGDDVDSSPAVADDGTIYVGADDQKLYALSPEGSLKWAFTAGGDLRASPAIAPDGIIYVGGFDGLLYAIRPDGTLNWTFRTGDRILSSVLVDGGGALAFGSQDDRLYALEPDGRVRWTVELGGDVDSSPILGPDGTVYVGADDHKLYALH